MRTFAIITLIATGLLAPRITVAQDVDSSFLPDYARAAITGQTLTVTQNGIQQVECSSCGTLRPPSSAGCATCGGGMGTMCSDGCGSALCKPGRNCRYTENCGNNFLDRFFGGISECLCCPDPCYEPVWVTAANSAFFQDTVRPKTYTRYRYNNYQSMSAPRIAEYFMSSQATAVRPVDSQEFSLYQEIASDKAAFFIETPYRSLDYEGGHNAGFADLVLGTKSMLLDCELMQFTFQFKTFLPVGSAPSGTGTGHVSLEPSLLLSLKLFDATYMQSQVAYWIPISGNQDFAGSIFHYHVSFNQLFVDRGPWQVIGTAELNGWVFSTGAATDVGDLAGSRTYYTVGPGLRLVYCENYDIGFGYGRSISEHFLGENQYRAELRIRF